MKEVLSDIEQIVEKAEDKYIAGLLEWEIRAKHRAEACKCLQCQGEAGRASQSVQNEIFRVFYGPDMDEEEEWIANQALITLYERETDS